MTVQQDALAASHDRLAALEHDARAIQRQGPRKRNLAGGMLAAIAHTAEGTQDGCGQAIGDLENVRADAEHIVGSSGAPAARRVAEGAINELGALRAIVWSGPIITTGRAFGASWSPQGHNSGLAWHTGMGNAGAQPDQAEPAFAAWLGREHCDVYSSFIPHDTVADVTHHAHSKATTLRPLAQANVRIAQVVPLLTAEHAARVDEVINGPLTASYRAMWTALAQGMKDAGCVDPIFRLGHEMNLGSSYPWNNSNHAMTPAKFVALYKLAAAAVSDVFPTCCRAWNPGKAAARGNSADYWPGDELVDAVLVDWYDNGSHVGFIADKASWDRGFNAGTAANPIGLGRWRAFAEAHGKPMGMPEWGITPHGGSHDDAYFVTAVGDFMAQLAADGKAVMETYYNSGEHSLQPAGSGLSRASAAYKARFGRS